MRVGIAASMLALIAAPAARRRARGRTDIARHLHSIVPGDGAGGVAAAMRINGRIPILELRVGRSRRHPADHQRYAVQSRFAAQDVLCSQEP
jgi:hypothetical protein